MSVCTPTSAAPPDLASPVLSPAEGSSKSALVGNHPQSPISPQSMALSFQRYEASQANLYMSSYAAEATPQLTSSETSPSTMAMSAQASQQAVASTMNTFPTPASSVGGYPTSSSRPNLTDGEVDVEIKTNAGDTLSMLGSPAGGSVGPEAQGAQGNRGTSHDRKRTIDEISGANEGSHRAQAADMGSEPPLKKRRSYDTRAISERLRADVGPLYMLCRDRKALSLIRGDSSSWLWRGH